MNIGSISGSTAGSISGSTAGSIISGLAECFLNDAARTMETNADESFSARLEAAVSKRDDKELLKACREFESIMLNIMYKQMKATVIKSTLIKEEPGTKIYESMQDESLMEAAAEKGGFGLADSLYKQLVKRYI